MENSVVPLGKSRNPDAIPSPGASLEDQLIALSAYGKPRISHDGGGWYCAIDMYVSAAGVDFKVASDFSRPSPRSAAEQCAERLRKTLAELA